MVSRAVFLAVLLVLFHVCQGKQYHIQTDEGDTRYFKYETDNGQYRKETRLKDGSVVGSYGWVAQDGYLHLYDYVADNDGYRIVRRRKINPDKTPSNSEGLHNLRIPPVSPPPPQSQPVDSVEGPLDSESIYFPNEVDGMMPGRNAPVKFPVSGVPIITPTPSSPSSVSVEETTKRLTFSDLFQVHNPFPTYAENRGHPNNSNVDLDASVSEEVKLGTTLAPRPHDTISVKSQEKRLFHPIFHSTVRPSIDAARYKTIYNLKKQFHVEKTLPSGDREGSHGYVDPFGILRITHYKTGPQGHRTRFENRFVGKDFDASSINH